MLTGISATATTPTSSDRPNRASSVAATRRVRAGRSAVLADRRINSARKVTSQASGHGLAIHRSSTCSYRTWPTCAPGDTSGGRGECTVSWPWMTAPGARVHVALDGAEDHGAIGADAQIAADDGAGVEADAPPRDHRVVADGVVNVHGLAGGPEIVADGRVAPHAPAGTEHVAFDRSGDGDAGARGGDIALDVRLDLHRLGRGEHVLRARRPRGAQQACADEQRQKHRTAALGHVWILSGWF